MPEIGPDTPQDAPKTVPGRRRRSKRPIDRRTQVGKWGRALIASLGGEEALTPEAHVLVEAAVRAKERLDQGDLNLQEAERVEDRLLRLLDRLQEHKRPNTKHTSTPSALDYLAARRAQERPPEPPTADPVKVEAMGTGSPTPTQALVEETPPSAAREEPKPEDPERPLPSRCAPCTLVGQRECPHVAPPASAPSESDPGPKIISPPDHQLGLPPGIIDKIIETARKTGNVKGLIQLCRRRDLDDDPEFARQRRFSPPRVINLAGNPFGRRA